MAHRTTSYTYRSRTLAPPPPSDTPNNNTSSMDPTPPLFHPPPSPTTTKPHHHYPDPPSSSSSSSIHSISNHFSKLYTNHKTLSSSSLRPSSGPPSIDTHLQARPMMASSATSSHSSTASLTKSFSQRRPEIGKEGRRGFRVKDKVNKECDEGQEIKREIISSKFDEAPKEFSKKERDFLLEGGHKLEVIKKPYFSMATNQEIIAVKELRDEYHELKRQSFSSSLGLSEGRRRSFCSSQAELANFLSCNGVKVVAVDMAPFMQIHAVDCARKTHDSLEKFTAKTLALTLKKEFDGVYGPAWHCIVGTSFGSFVTHSVGGFLYFSMDQKHYVLLFKTTVQKAS